jgi:glycosyltransferase involved in cell wall biosynthesis
MVLGFDSFLARSNVDAELSIAGGFDDPTYEAVVASAHRALPFEDKIRFLGSRSDVVELLTQSDVFVHTAAYEAHSVAILEAAAAAVPIVSSDLASIRESLGSRAEYFPPGNVQALVDALQRVTERWPERIRVARGLAEDVKSRYSMRACANAHLAVLHRAAEAR